MQYAFYIRTLFAFFVLFSPMVLQAVESGDAVNGKLLYDRLCSACHSVETNRIGPKHQNTFGQAVASVKDFAYSEALSSAELQWDEQSLDEWLSDPEAMIPGQRMFFRVNDALSRKDIIAYLKKISIHD